MCKWRLLFFAIGLTLCVRSTRAQGTLPAFSLGPCAVTTPSNQSVVGVGANKVACTLPQLYGADGLTFNNLDQGPLLQFALPGPSVQQDLLLPLNTNVASQIALLPFVTPSAGLTFTFDKSLGVFTISQDSFGPMFSERASTIGRNRLSLGFSYQYLNFNSLDGIDLHSFPNVTLEAPVQPFSGFLGAQGHSHQVPSA